MIYININDYKNNDCDILGDILDKVKSDEFIIDKNIGQVKRCSFGNDAITGEELITEYQASDDLKIADMIVDDIIKLINRNVDKITNITIKDWFYYWRSKCKYNCGLTHLNALENRLNNSILPAIGNIRLQEYKTSYTSACLDYCKKKNYSEFTKRHTLECLRDMINKAVYNGLLSENQEITLLLKTFEKKFIFFSDDELDYVMNDFLNSHYSLLYLFSLAIGIRINSLITLRKRDINLEKQEIVSTRRVTKVWTSDNISAHVIVDSYERKYHPHNDIIKALLEFMKNAKDDEYYFFTHYNLYNDYGIEKDLTCIFKKNNIKHGGQRVLTNTAERIAIEQGMNHVNFKYVFGYNDYRKVTYKYDAINKKGKRQKMAERRFIKLLNDIKKGIRK